MEEFKLYEMYLKEIIEERKNDLINKDKEYKKLREKMDKIFDEYPNLQLILEENRKVVLNETECKMLQN